MHHASEKVQSNSTKIHRFAAAVHLDPWAVYCCKSSYPLRKRRRKEERKGVQRERDGR